MRWREMQGRRERWREEGREMEGAMERVKDEGREEEMEMVGGIMSIAVAETSVIIGQALDQTLKHIYQHPH